jgi:hypothetical protein
MKNPFSKSGGSDSTSRPEPTEGAKRELALAAEAYASRASADMFKAADAKTATTTAHLAAQRAAAIKWSAPPESRNGGE